MRSVAQPTYRFTFASLAGQVAGVAVQLGGTTYLMPAEDDRLYVVPDPQQLVEQGPVHSGIVAYLTEELTRRLARHVGGA